MIWRGAKEGLEGSMQSAEVNDPETEASVARPTYRSNLVSVFDLRR